MIGLEVDRNPVEAAAEEFLERRRRGERPSIQEYVDRYPDHAARIRDLFPTMLVMEKARPNPTEEAKNAKRLGDFRIISEIGRGGMGVVYEAWQESLARRVALKVLPHRVLDTPSHLQRFHREVRAAARLHHTNIVPVYGVGQHDGMHFYVMQFIEGASLDQVLSGLRWRQAHPAGRTSAAVPTPRDLAAPTLTMNPYIMPPFVASQGPVLQLGSGVVDPELSPRAYWRWVARIGLEVAAALEHAHRLGVVHRDIKPSNLLLDGNGRVWITDFGLAKLATGKSLPDSENDAGSLTHTGDLVGTIRYMAPERFQGQADAGGDIYGLGLTLYELAALRPAFDAKNHVELMKQAITAEPPRLRSLNRRIPRDLETIIARAMHRDPARRYRTAEDLAADLRRFAEGRPIHARRTSSIEHAWRWCRRNPLVASLAGLVLLLAVASCAMIVFQMEEAIDKGELARRERNEAWIANWKLKQNSQDLRDALYAAKINLAANAWDAPGGLRRTRELLRQLQPKPGDSDVRNFEWHYLNRLCHPEQMVLADHDSAVHSVAYSPDGTRLVCATQNGVIYQWDVLTRKNLRSWSGHGDLTGGMALAPDGSIIATAGTEIGTSRGTGVGGVIKLWNAHTGALLRSITPNQALRFFTLAFSPDGRRLLVGAGTQLTNRNFYTPRLVVFDTTTGKEVLAVDDCGGASVAFQEQGRHIVGTALDGTLRVLDAVTGARLTSFPGQAKLATIAVSPDERSVAGGHNNGVVLWDARTGKELWRTAEKKVDVSSITFSPDGQLLAATPRYDGIVRLFDAKTGKELRTFRGHEGWIEAATFDPAGRFLATGAHDRSVLLWDLRAKAQPCVIESNESGTIVGLSQSADGRRLVTRHQTVVASQAGWTMNTRVWDAQTGQVIHRYNGEDSTAIAAMVNGDRHVTWTKAGDVMVRDLAGGVPLLLIRESVESIREVALSSKSEKLAVLGSGKDDTGRALFSAVTVRSAQTGEVLQRFGEERRLIDHIAFSPDGAYLAETSVPCEINPQKMEIALRDIVTGRKSIIGTADEGMTLSVCFSPDGQRLVTTHKDGVRIWDPWAGKELHHLKGHTSVVCAAAFTPDSRRLATASMDQTVKIWDPATGHDLLTLKGENLFRSLTFNADGSKLLASYATRVVGWEAGR